MSKIRFAFGLCRKRRIGYHIPSADARNNFLTPLFSAKPQREREFLTSKSTEYIKLCDLFGLPFYLTHQATKGFKTSALAFRKVQHLHSGKSSPCTLGSPAFALREAQPLRYPRAQPLHSGECSLCTSASATFTLLRVHPLQVPDAIWPYHRVLGAWCVSSAPGTSY